MAGEETAHLKEAFVREWLRTNDPFKAGFAAFPTDNGRAMRASWEWPIAADVLELRAQLLADEGLDGVLPNKSELARNVLMIAQGERTSTDNRLEAYKLYGQIMGFIEKPAPPKPLKSDDDGPATFIIAADNVG